MTNGISLLFVCHSSQNQQDVLPTGPVQTERLGFAGQPGTAPPPPPPLYICVRVCVACLFYLLRAVAKK